MASHVLTQTHRIARQTALSSLRFIGLTVCANYTSSPSQGEQNFRFIPPHTPPATHELQALTDFVRRADDGLVVLTGAGVSTFSGIPDYRSQGVGLYATGKNRPVQYVDFIKKLEIRQRYWARNYMGWPRFSSCLPNLAHKVLSDWERAGRVSWLVTQNVDSLHQKAGARSITELHGSAYRVVCLICAYTIDRHHLQDMLRQLNTNWKTAPGEMAPDGDVALTAEQIDGFKMCSCPRCGGVLKPEITFFGDNVARHLVELVFTKVEQASALLVVGSSLQVYSGYRFVHRAVQDWNKPVAILNIGSTRADDLATLKISALCSDVLKQVDVLLR